MQLEYGTEVIDRNGKILGTVGQVMRNSWTGEISKFIVHQETPSRDRFFSPQDVLEATESEIRLGISSDELNKSE